MKLIVSRIDLNRHTSGSKVGEWIYSEAHKAFILGGKEFSGTEWNRLVETPQFKTMLEDYGAGLKIQCVGIKDMAAARAKSPIGKRKNEPRVIQTAS